MRGLLVLLAACGRVGFEPSSAPLDSDPSLRAHFAFEDDLADGADDSNGRFTAACTTCPTTVGGRIGKGAQFDGATTVLVVEAAATAFTNPRFTFATWLFLDDDSVNHYPISKRHGSADADSIGFFMGPTGTCMETVVASGDVVRCAGDVLPTATWQHVALTYDGALLQLSVDGVGILFEPLQEAIVFDANPVRFGADIDPGIPVHLPLAGRLDDVRIYDRALDASDLAQLADP